MDQFMSRNDVSTFFTLELTKRHLDLSSPYLLVLFKLDPRVLEQFHAVLRVHVLSEVELEVELPGGDTLGQIAILVQERQTQLDYLQEVHVAAKELVLVISSALELP